MTIYSKEQLAENIIALDGWSLVNDAIEKDFIFKDFAQAVSFIVHVGFVSEKMNHHPEILNVYNKVKIRLNTHDVQSITSIDFDLAAKIDNTRHK